MQPIAPAPQSPGNKPPLSSTASTAGQPPALSPHDATAAASRALSRESARPGPRPRAIQFVTTLADRRTMAQWMFEEVSRCGTDKHIASKVVRQFPTFFPGNSKANLMRATRIWRQRVQLLHEPEASPTPVVPIKVNTRVQKRSLPGRGRKRAPWSEKLQTNLLEEYIRLKSGGFVFTPRSVRTAAIALLSADHRNSYCKDMKDPKSDRSLVECITARWIRAFGDRMQISLDDRPVGPNVPPYKRKQIELNEKLIAYHLGCIARQFRDGTLNDGDIEVLTPMHFLLSTSTGKTLGFGEEEQPEFTELMDGARPLTMLVRVSGGKHAKVETPFMIFQDADRTYPIPGVGDESPDVCYRTSPTGWLDTFVLTSCFEENRVIATLPDGRKRVIFVEPSTWLPLARGIEVPLGRIKTELRFFPKNGGRLTQPMETGIREEIKEVWKSGWQEMKTRMIDLGVWDDEGRDASGKKFNAGPRFFLKLAAAAIQAVNDTRHADGMNYARKAMIRTGMSMNVNGKWELEQLHPELRAIAAKHKRQYDGEVVTVEEKPRPPRTQRQAEKEQAPHRRVEPSQGRQQSSVQQAARPLVPQSQEQANQQSATRQGTDQAASERTTYHQAGSIETTQGLFVQQQGSRQGAGQVETRSQEDCPRERSQPKVS